MSKFLLISPSHDRLQAIGTDLASIRLAVTNDKLAQLFEQYATRSYRKGSEERRKQVAVIVRRVKEEINQLHQLHAATIRNKLNPVRHDEEVPILRKGCSELNQIKRRPLSMHELENGMYLAVQEDRAKFDEIAMEVEQKRQNPQTILVRSMEDPSWEETIDDELSTYNALRWYLSRLGINKVEMWIRHENVDLPELPKLTPISRWEYAPPSENIRDDKETLEIDVVKLEKRGAYYIVAVVAEESDKVIPIPLDLSRGGDGCCDINSSNLRTHLKQLWPSHIVTKAIHLGQGSDAWTYPLSDDHFKDHSNDLFLRRRKIQR